MMHEAFAFKPIVHDGMQTYINTDGISHHFQTNSVMTGK